MLISQYATAVGSDNESNLNQCIEVAADGEKRRAKAGGDFLNGDFPLQCAQEG